MIALTLAMLLPTTDAASAQRADVPHRPAAAVRQAPVPTMRLEAQFRGPQQDTVVQRWRDPTTNAICYIYLPITVQHSAPTPTGYVQYGANSIGTISCISGK